MPGELRNGGCIMRDEIPIWTIYGKPQDYPEHFVVRRWTVLRGRAVADFGCTLFEDLDSARASVPAGCYPIGRNDADDPAIVESWM